MSDDVRELQWTKADGSKVTLGASMAAASYYVELPNEPGPHSVQVSYDAALAADAGRVEVSNQPTGAFFDVQAGLWSPSGYTTAAVVASAVGSKACLIPDILVGRRRFVLPVTTEGVARVFVR